MQLSITSIVLAINLVAPPVSAQNHFVDNPFFGFEFVLEPLATKWSCGGDQQADLTRIQMLIDAFPEDAKQAELPEIIDSLIELSKGAGSVTKLLGADLTAEEFDILCDAALPLNAEWLIPETFASREAELSEDQKKAWAVYWETIEQIQILHNNR